MAETIIVRCAYCGEKIGEISYVPGTQVIGCQCERRTDVRITADGEVYTSKHY